MPYIFECALISELYMTPSEAVRHASQILKGQTQLGRLIGVTTPTVSQWCSGIRPVPPLRALQIEAVTNGAVCREALCPGFPWKELVERLLPSVVGNVPESEPDHSSVDPAVCLSSVERQ